MLNIFMIIFEQSMIYLPLVFGSYISFSLLKVPDLSLETAYLIGAFCGGSVLQVTQGYSAAISCTLVIGASVLGGMAVGAVSSCMTRFGKIPHLLSAIITFGLFQGLFLMCSNAYVSLAQYKNVFMEISGVTGYPELMALCLINLLLCCGCVYLLCTQLGHSFVIFGQNAQFFEHFKISTNYVFIVGIMLANGLAGLAGFFFAQTNNLVEMNMGVGKALFCITVLIVGKAIVATAKSSCLVPFVGSLSYFTLQQLLLKVGFNLKYFTMMQSFLVLCIVLNLYTKKRGQYDQLGV